MTVKDWLHYKHKIDYVVWKYVEETINPLLVKDYYVSYYSDGGVVLSSISGRNSSLTIKWEIIEKEMN